MTLYFIFTDAPHLSDTWETKLDVNELVHTRPPLLAQRDHYARNYGSGIAQDELTRYIFYGLKAFGYEHFPQLYESLYELISGLRHQAVFDQIVAFRAELGGPEEFEKYRAMERRLLDQALEVPQVMTRFIEGLMMELSQLGPVERLRGVYALNGACLGHLIPYSRKAPDRLAEAFGGKQVIPDLPKKNTTTADTDQDTTTAVSEPPDLPLLDTKELHTELFADSIHCLIHRLETQPAFLDRILERWVVPLLEEHYLELDDYVDEMRQYMRKPVSRDEYIRMRTADDKWLEMAQELGSPVPGLGE